MQALRALGEVYGVDVSDRISSTSRCRYLKPSRTYESSARYRPDNWGVSHMLRLILLIVLILAILGSVPMWGYSTGWGYGPSGGLGLVLLIVLILILAGRL
jgi:hypothetical protein